MTRSTAQPLYRITETFDSGHIGSIRCHEGVVLVFGPDASACNVMIALDALAEHAAGTRCTTIVMTTREQQADFQALVDAGRLFYLSCGALAERELDALIDGARGVPRREAALNHFLPADDLRRMALAGSVADLSHALQGAIGNAVSTNRSRCVLFDRAHDVLWTPGETDEESAAVGLVSFILRTGMTVCLARLEGDPRVDPGVDNPDGTLTDRFLGVPVRAAHGPIVAVLVALRPAQEAPFEPLDVAALEALAAHASPYLGSCLLDAPSSPSRLRALRDLDQPLFDGPKPLRPEPRWTRSIPWLAVGAFVAFLLALVFVGLQQG